MIIVCGVFRGFIVEFGVALRLDVSGLPLPPIDANRPLAVLKIVYTTHGDTRINLDVWQELEQFIGQFLLRFCHWPLLHITIFP